MKVKSKSDVGYFLAVLGLVVLLLAASLTISVTIGAVDVSAADVGKILVNRSLDKEIFAATWESKTENIIWNIRFPRVLMAFFVGQGLALCGVLMQALTKNPLADPYVLGISSGASSGAVCAILLGWFNWMGGYSTMFGATLGAMASICLSLSIASIHGRITSTQLVLAGIATSALFSAFTNLIVYGFNSGSDRTKMALYWMVGSLSGSSWSKLKYVAIVSFVVICVIFLFAKHLDVLLLGDDVAETLGMDTRKMKLMIIAASTILTGVVVSVSGVIGFVGLVVPHVMRSFVGSNHRRLIPISILGGGLFTMIVDLIARTVMDPNELPIGVVAAFFGAPFFLYLIKKGNMERRR